MADYIPLYDGAVPATHTTSAAVTGGTLLSVSGDGTVATMAAAGASCVGVAAFDAASGARVTVFRSGIQLLTAGGSITAGNTLEATTGGQVVAHTNGTNDCNIVGVALNTVSSTGTVRVLMKI